MVYVNLGYVLKSKGRCVALLIVLVCLALTVSACGSKTAQKETVGFAKAKAEYDAGRFVESEKALLALLEDDPENAEALQTLALALAAQGKNEEAVAQYAKLVKLNPKDHASWYRMALLERIVGKPDKTVVHLQKALERDPGNRSYTDELARTQMSLGRYAEAAKLWGDLLEDKKLAKESRKELLLLQGQAYLSGKEYAKAKTSFEKALKLDPDDKALKARIKSFD